MGAGAGVCGCVGQVCTGTLSLTQSEHRQTERQTYRQTDRGAYSAVLLVDFPSPCPASETPTALAPPHLRDTCDGSR